MANTLHALGGYTIDTWRVDASDGLYRCALKIREGVQRDRHLVGDCTIYSLGLCMFAPAGGRNR